MDAEGGGDHVHRERRVSARMLAVVLALQNALVAACLLVTLYVFWIVQNQEPMKNVHIQFGTISGVLRNETLQFGLVDSKNTMSRADGNAGMIIINCTGPYVLYIDLCYKSLDLEKGHLNTTGTLQLQVKGSGTPRSSFRLQASHVKVCRGLHSIAFLRAKEQASLHLYSDRSFVMSELTVGLSYLLGTEAQCYF
ncbi:hypothetical protein JOB18_029891 [Solea senegalensis]|uniref:TNF family profile domain-containing protein n=1 Tax=Solea senegalensis TaxID=28829 RepID=A0AAV6SDY7_SOLSE|nr:hypothetical protein JOB18_029891 [Solea senegalensis]